MGKHRRVEIGRAHVNSSHLVISYAVFCLKKKNNDAPDFPVRHLDETEARHAGPMDAVLDKPDQILRLEFVDELLEFGFFLMIRRPPICTIFPYTALFL